MARVTVDLQGRRIGVNCADGQEERVREVAAYVDRRMGEIRQILRGASDLEVLGLVAIAMGDELLSLQQTSDEPAAAGDGPAAASGDGEAGRHDPDATVAPILETLSGRIESLAARFEEP